MIDGIGSGSSASFGSLMSRSGRPVASAAVANVGDAVSAAQFAALTGRAGAVNSLINGRAARHTEVVAGDDAATAGGATIPADVTRLLGERNGVRMVRSPEHAARLYDQARTPEDKKVKETADQFVSILYSMLFKQLDATVQKSGLIDGGKTEKMFQSFVLDEYAKQAASQNSNNPVSHRIYEMLYEATAARRPGAFTAAPASLGAASLGAASHPVAESETHGSGADLESSTPVPSSAPPSFSAAG